VEISVKQARVASWADVGGREAALVQRCAAGDEAACAELVAEHQRMVVQLAINLLGDRDEALDLSQDVFLRVFHTIHRFRGDSSLKTWIYRIAVHEASNRKRWWFRHKARETSMESPDATLDSPAQSEFVDQSESPFDSIVHEEIRARVEEEVRQVPEPYRTTLILRDLEEMSYEEIAEITEVSLGTVKSRLTRGREALKERLADYIRQVGPQLGLQVPELEKHPARSGSQGGEFEVAS
jgi:RNA polymerase sigma-70 factor (ECF subfamily)